MTRLTSAARRLQIEEVARRLFLNGPDSTSMQKIANEAGVNSALLYQHFTSIAEIFETVMLEPLEQRVLAAIEEARTGVAAPADAREALLVLHTSLLELMVEVAPAMGVILFVDRFPGRRFFVERVSPPLKRWVEETLTHYGLLLDQAPNSDVQVAALIGIHLHIALDAYLRRKPLDVADEAERVSNIYCSGLFERRN